MATYNQITDPKIKALFIKNRGKKTSNDLGDAFMWSPSPEGGDFWEYVDENPGVSFCKIKHLLPKGYKFVGYILVKSLYLKVTTGMKYKAVTTYGTKFSGIIHINESGDILLCNKNGVGISFYGVKGYGSARNVKKGTVANLKSNGVGKIEIMFDIPETKPETVKPCSKVEPCPPISDFTPITSLKDIKSGIEFTAKIDRTEVEGKIQIEKGRYFLCQNKKEGTDCRNKLGYKYSWVVGDGTKSSLKGYDVTSLKIKIDKPVEPKPTPTVYKDLQVTFCKDHVIINGVKITDEQLQGIAMAQGLFEVIE